MKLAFLTATFPCLTETFVLREWEYLSRDEMLDIQVFSMRKPSGYSRIELPKDANLQVQYLRPDHLFGIILACIWFPVIHPLRAIRAGRLLLKELPVHPVRKWGALFFQVVAGSYLGTYLKHHGFEVIHGHFSSASSIALFAHLASDIPFSYTIYANDDLFVTPVSFFMGKLEYCTQVVTDTEYNRRMINLLTEFRFKDKVQVVYTGLNLDAFKNVQPKEELSKPLRLLSVGSMSGFKGYPTVLEALRILKEHDVGFEYRIVGGGDATMLEKLIEQYNLNGSVKLLGAQDFERVREEFERCDMFIMASEINAGGRRDGFPTVIAEAMLLKRLVIATYISDIPNNVINHETGLIVAEKNPQQLADAIEYVIQAPKECRQMVEKAHDRASKKYNAAKNYHKLARLMEAESK